MNKIMSYMLIFSLLLAMPIHADNTTFTCLSNTTSRESMYIEVEVDGNPTIVTTSEDVACGNGCNNQTGECNLSQFDTGYLIIFIIFPIISFVLLYFSSILKTEDWAVHMLLMFSALFFLLAPMGILQGMQMQSNAIFGSGLIGLYQVLLVIVVVIFLYYILKLIINGVRLMQARRAEATGGGTGTA